MMHLWLCKNVGGDEMNGIARDFCKDGFTDMDEINVVIHTTQLYFGDIWC